MVSFFQLRSKMHPHVFTLPPFCFSHVQILLMYLEACCSSYANEECIRVMLLIFVHSFVNKTRRPCAHSSCEKTERAGKPLRRIGGQMSQRRFKALDDATRERTEWFNLDDIQYLRFVLTFFIETSEQAGLFFARIGTRRFDRLRRSILGRRKNDVALFFRSSVAWHRDAEYSLNGTLIWLSERRALQFDEKLFVSLDTYIQPGDPIRSFVRWKSNRVKEFRISHLHR